MTPLAGFGIIFRTLSAVPSGGAVDRLFPPRTSRKKFSMTDQSAFSACRRSLRSSLRTAAVLAATLLVASLSSANVMAGTFVDWSFDSSGTGTADGVTVTSTFSASSNAITFQDLSGIDFNPPGSASQQVFRASVGSSITWSFAQPVEDFLLYVVNWRGSSSGGPTDDLYTFNQTPTIQSGLAGVTISGNSLVVGANNFYNGILSFPGPLTSLSLAAPVGASSTLSARNEYTMSFNAVPEPSTLGLLACGALGMGGVWYRRRKRAGGSLQRTNEKLSV